MRKTGLKLPDNFAQSILDYDIQIVLADDPKSQVITKITQLYTLGMQYYESIKSYKYFYFQKKINELFVLLQKKSQQKNTSPPKKLESKNRVSVPKNVVANQLQSPLKKKLQNGNDQEKLQALLIKQQQQKMQTQIDTSISNTGIQVNNLLNSREEKLSTFDSIISKEMNEQNSKLQNRLAMRKKNSTNTKLTRKANSTITEKNLFNVFSMDQEKEESSQSTYYYRGSYEGSQESDRKCHDLINYNAILIEDHLSNDDFEVEQKNIKIDFLEQCEQKNKQIKRVNENENKQSMKKHDIQDEIHIQIQQRLGRLQKGQNNKTNLLIKLQTTDLISPVQCLQKYNYQKQQIIPNKLQPIFETNTQNTKEQPQNIESKFHTMNKKILSGVLLPQKKESFTSQGQHSLSPSPSKTKLQQKYTKILKKSKKNKTQMQTN